jgi:hypothetical protein
MLQGTENIILSLRSIPAVSLMLCIFITGADNIAEARVLSFILSGPAIVGHMAAATQKEDAQ